MNLLILDRDGVINADSDEYIKSEEEWVPIPGSLEAIAEFCKAGYHVAVATNQSGLGRGLFSEFDLARIHHKMCSMVEALGGHIDGIFYCPHLPADDCQCRKPRIGLLREIEREFGQPLVGIPYIGDSLKDLQAANTAGCRPILVRTGKGAATEESLSKDDLSNIEVFPDLQAVSRFLLGGNRQ